MTHVTTQAKVWRHFLSSRAVWLHEWFPGAEYAFHWCWGSWNTKDFLTEVALAVQEDSEEYEMEKQAVEEVQAISIR